MKTAFAAAIILAIVASAAADDVTALQGLQQCVNNIKSSAPYLQGWGGSVASAGRKLQQTAENCAQAAAISSAIPCTPQTTPASLTTPTLPNVGTPPTAGAGPGVNTSPSGIPTGTSSNPCGDGAANPVPWTGIQCDGGRVTRVIMSQLGPNAFKGTCNISNLAGLAGLDKLQFLDFTASGLIGTVPASWATGAWNGSLQTLTLAQNPNITGPLPSFANFTALTSIDVSSSGLTGSIPLSAQGYPALKSFVAVGNQFSGPLPQSLPASLTTLNVGNNKLNGTLPVYNSTSLTTLQVNNNTLSGCLPSQWPSTLTNITNIDISYAGLSGPIPDTWQAQGAFPTLQTINIVGNNLCGSTGALGTPVRPVGQNNPNASRLVPAPGNLPACTGTSC